MKDVPSIDRTQELDLLMMTVPKTTIGEKRIVYVDLYEELRVMIYIYFYFAF